MAGTSDHVKDWYRSNFELFESSLNGESKGALHQLRKEGLHRFLETGFPTTREEEWRFTNVDPIAKTTFRPVVRLEDQGITRKDIRAYGLQDVRSIRLVFLNGHFEPTLSSAGKLPKGVRVQSLASVIGTESERLAGTIGRHVAPDANGFAALNTAFLQDGAYISVPEQTDLEEPIHLLFVTTKQTEPFAVQPRLLITAGKGSRVTLVESYVSLADSTHLTNAVAEIIVEEGAVVEHDKLQNESESAYHISSATVHQSTKSVYTSNMISLGGAITRNSLTVLHGGEFVETTLNGLSIGTGTQLIDTHTTIDHAEPNCVSHELYKTVLDGTSRGVFNGKIYVRQDAQKTDAKQTNKTLLLSDDATINAKPQLEIFADDVKCTHGATVGQLDAEQVFYLRTRGIGLDDARDILTFAFASDVVNRVNVEAVRDQLEPLIHAKLDRGRGMMPS